MDIPNYLSNIADHSISSQEEVPLLKKPKTVKELAAYYHQISSPSERKYLSERCAAWINTGNFPLSGDTWEDAIELLSMHDARVSSTWLQFIFNIWQTNLAQPDWIKSVLNSTILRLVYEQPEVLSFGGAVGILDKMLDWLADAEEKLGQIPSGAEEAWRIIVVITSLLTISYKEGVGGSVFKKFFSAIVRLDWNIGALKSKSQELSKQHAGLLADIEKEKFQGQVLKVKQKEVEELQKQIGTISVQANHLQQLVTILKANRAALEVQGTRLQKIGLGVDVVTNLAQALTFAITGVGAAAGGTAVLAGAIASVPVTYGAGALLLIPAIAGFASGVLAGGASLVGAGFSGAYAAMDIYLLGRSADKHPINQLFLSKNEENLLTAIKEKYLIEIGGKVQLKPDVKGRDSLHLLQFMGELWVHLGGASALKEDIKPDVINDVKILLKAIYQAHSRKQKGKDKTVCQETISLMQVLQQRYGWAPLLEGVSPEQLEANLSPEQWAEIYQKDGWLSAREKCVARITGYIKSSANPLLLKYPRIVENVASSQADKKQGENDTLFLPWSVWYAHDEAVDLLAAMLYGASLKKVTTAQLKLQASEIESYILLAEERFKQNNEQPWLSTYALALSKQLIQGMEQVESIKQKDLPVFSEEQLEKTLKDKMLTPTEKTEVVSKRANTVIQTLSPEDRDQIFKYLDDTSLKEDNRFKLLQELLRLPRMKIRTEIYVKGDEISRIETIIGFKGKALSDAGDVILKLRRGNNNSEIKEKEVTESEKDILADQDIKAVRVIMGNRIIEDTILQQQAKVKEKKLKKQALASNNNRDKQSSPSKSMAQLVNDRKDSPRHGNNNQDAVAANDGVASSNGTQVTFNYMKFNTEEELSKFEAKLALIVKLRCYTIVEINKTPGEFSRYQLIKLATAEEAKKFAKDLNDVLLQPAKAPAPSFSF